MEEKREEIKKRDNDKKDKLQIGKELSYHKILNDSLVKSTFILDCFVVGLSALFISLQVFSIDHISKSFYSELILYSGLSFVISMLAGMLIFYLNQNFVYLLLQENINKKYSKIRMKIIGVLLTVVDCIAYLSFFTGVVLSVVYTALNVI